jgi:hypothetical protein
VAPGSGVGYLQFMEERQVDSERKSGRSTRIQDIEEKKELRAQRARENEEKTRRNRMKNWAKRAAKAHRGETILITVLEQFRGGVPEEITVNHMLIYAEENMGWIVANDRTEVTIPHPNADIRAIEESLVATATNKPGEIEMTEDQNRRMSIQELNKSLGEVRAARAKEMFLSLFGESFLRSKYISFADRWGISPSSVDNLKNILLNIGLLVITTPSDQTRFRTYKFDESRVPLEWVDAATRPSSDGVVEQDPEEDSSSDSGDLQIQFLELKWDNEALSGRVRELEEELEIAVDDLALAREQREEQEINNQQLLAEIEGLERRVRDLEMQNAHLEGQVAFAKHTLDNVHKEMAKKMADVARQFAASNMSE